MATLVDPTPAIDEVVVPNVAPVLGDRVIVVDRPHRRCRVRIAVRPGGVVDDHLLEREICLAPAHLTATVEADRLVSAPALRGMTPGIEVRPAACPPIPSGAANSSPPASMARTATSVQRARRPSPGPRACRRQPSPRRSSPPLPRAAPTSSISTWTAAANSLAIGAEGCLDLGLGCPGQWMATWVVPSGSRELVPRGVHRVDGLRRLRLDAGRLRCGSRRGWSEPGDDHGECQLPGRRRVRRRA